MARSLPIAEVNLLETRRDMIKTNDDASALQLDGCRFELSYKKKVRRYCTANFAYVGTMPQI